MDKIIPQTRQTVEKAFRSVYGDLVSYFTSYTVDVMAAEDMAQDLFLKLLSVDVIMEDTVRQLVFTMARRMVIDDSRHKAFVRKATERYLYSVDIYDKVSPAIHLQAKEVKEWEQRFLAEMAPKRAKVYRLYKSDEMSATDIAMREGLSKRTVEAHIYLSTKAMREKMRKVI